MNLRCFQKLGSFLGVSGLFKDFRDYFQNLTPEWAVTQYEY
jgi:hypothetical protein